jgi:hypothetical protein
LLQHLVAEIEIVPFGLVVSATSNGQLKEEGQMPMSVTQGIGVLSSISFRGTKLADAFQKGLGRPEVYINVQDNRGYDPKSLDQAVHTLNNDIKVGLIVTVGGLVSAQAAGAKTGATIPFISLVGGTPGAFPSQGQGYFRGGISLETFAHNPHRVAHLKGLGVPENKVCLLSNPNSHMAAAETAAWVASGRGPVITAGASAGLGTSNSATTYRPAFAAIAAANMSAVVVSADPFFKETMDELIDAANNWIAGGPGRRICYPLHDYANASGKCKPAPGHTLHGPVLEDAYESLGKMAANFLAGQPTTLQTLGINTGRDY